MSVNLASTVIKPLHREGPKFIAIFAIVTIALFFVSEVLGWIGVGLTVWCYYFFRDPARVTPAREGLMVSPADGIVSQVAPAQAPPELELGDAPLMRVSVFMSVFDCHVNRAAVGGTVVRAVYRPGRFFNAALDKASDDNERNGIVVHLEDGRRVGIVQIAGLVARRILCDVREGQRLATGERFGMIRFGSRLDVYLPDGVSPLVCEGQKMVAGETVIADLLASEPPRAGEIR
ncbi:phosphatidylserine decarboxylase [Roseitranquillus sediminis]|uniref:phosphatidylserine decarboxylase n=1 Tax=Roseitranquillus sediminis TaxID=2809051 RepID=UPI001D0C9FF1|nr:phosphatidylserine decarboxylase [Roseitranquillus sediminis]MBM9595799.1 phosphatidylserine decarboxylase [Roseitranquillus sediminis]